jgi:hypothetical protein
LAILVGELNRGGVAPGHFHLPIIIPLSMVGISVDSAGFGISPRPHLDGPGGSVIGLATLIQPFTPWRPTPGRRLLHFYYLPIRPQWDPQAIREAARVDKWFFPGALLYCHLVVTPLLLTGRFGLLPPLKVFDLPQTVTQGGPGVATLTCTFIPESCFQRFDMGLASRCPSYRLIILFIS